MSARRVPIIPTIIVAAAVATMIALGVWQLGRRAEKEALIASYKAAQTQEDIQLLVDPSSPKAAFTRTLEYCGAPKAGRVVSGRSATGQSGWVHVVQCKIGVGWPGTQSNCEDLYEVLERELSVKQTKPAFLESCVGRKVKPDPLHSDAKLTEIVLGWSRSPASSRWDGGFVTGTVVPTGEFGFKIVADPPLAGLQPMAKPDPGDLPNNHLAYAGQWFFFALTALVIYVLAIRRRAR
jgi:surfeit locus 1 family protein